MSDTSDSGGGTPTRFEVTGGTTEAPPASNAASLPQTGFQSENSFQQRLLQFAITLASNQSVGQPVSFAGSGQNTGTFEGFRASVRIKNAGSPASTQCDVSIWGLSDSTIQQLAVLGQVFNSVQKNSILISAGNPNSGFTPVFGGTIFAAMPDYNQAPDVPMIISAQTGYLSGVTPVPAGSFPQSTSIATIMQKFASAYPLTFENNGVNVQMPPSYFPGTLLQQIERAARHADITWQIINDKTLAIWPKGGSRSTISNIPLISAATGMIGRPSLSPNGYCIVRKIFDPTIQTGGKVQVMSTDVPQANRQWVVQKNDLELDSLIPKGHWRQTLYCYPVGLPAPAPPGS